MKKIISFDNTLDSQVPSIINSDFFSNTQQSVSIDYIPEDKKPKRGRPKKIIDGQSLLTNESGNADLPMYQTNEPYIETYSETNNMLKASVCQIDQLQSEIKNELDTIRASKTLKRKYDYISMLGGVVSGLVSSKIGAIRELNKITTDCHNLEMKRVKDLKLDTNGQDDDKNVQDMYNAFISMPVGSYSGPSSYSPPTINEMTLLNSGTSSTDIYQNYNQGYTVDPSVNAMLLRENPDIKTVVKYQSATGNREFDVINMKTGESVANQVQPPDASFLNDITIDTRNSIARNTQLDQTYPLIIIDNPNVSQY